MTCGSAPDPIELLARHVLAMDIVQRLRVVAINLDGCRRKVPGVIVEDAGGVPVVRLPEAIHDIAERIKPELPLGTAIGQHLCPVLLYAARASAPPVSGYPDVRHLHSVERNAEQALSTTDSWRGSRESWTCGDGSLPVWCPTILLAPRGKQHEPQAESLFSETRTRPDIYEIPHELQLFVHPDGWPSSLELVT